jgi:hypothetical protein
VPAKILSAWITRLIVVHQDWRTLCLLLEQPQRYVLDLFFEWLDYSDDVRRSAVSSSNGGGVTVDTCPHVTFDLRRYKKLTATERDAHQARLKDDVMLVLNNQRGQGDEIMVQRLLLNDDGDDDNSHNNNTSLSTMNNLTFQFVYGTDHQLYLLDENGHRLVPHVHSGHASIFAGRPILMAGEMGFVPVVPLVEEEEAAAATSLPPTSSSTTNLTTNRTDYRLVWISDSSGHYRPTLRHVQQFYRTLRDRHDVNVDALHWLVRGQIVDLALMSSLSLSSMSMPSSSSFAA